MHKFYERRSRKSIAGTSPIAVDIPLIDSFFIIKVGDSFTEDNLKVVVAYPTDALSKLEDAQLVMFINKT